MSDGTQLNRGADGDMAATDDILRGGVPMKAWIAKLGFGVDGTCDDVTAARPLPVTLDPIISAVVVRHDSGFMFSGSIAVAPKFAVINLTATGTLVAAVASKKIRVLALAMTCDALTGDETYTFNTGAGGTPLTGGFCDSSGAGPAVNVIVLPFNPIGWFETVAGALLELALAGTTPFAKGCLVYLEV